MPQPRVKYHQSPHSHVMDDLDTFLPNVDAAASEAAFSVLSEDWDFRRYGKTPSTEHRAGR